MYKIDGIREFQEGLQLNNPRFLIGPIKYGVITPTVEIEILFTEGEGIAKHSRTYIFECVGNWTFEDAVNVVLNHPDFQGAIEI
jgi:hypothetical protein